MSYNFSSKPYRINSIFYNIYVKDNGIADHVAQYLTSKTVKHHQQKEKKNMDENTLKKLVKWESRKLKYI